MFTRMLQATSHMHGALISITLSEFFQLQYHWTVPDDWRKAYITPVRVALISILTTTI